LKPETLTRKRGEPRSIGEFTTAAQDHCHYQGGRRVPA